MIVKRVWSSFLSHNHNNNIHVALGLTVNSVIAGVLKYMSIKNVSMTLIAFANLEDCFRQSLTLQLPFVGGEMEESKEI